MTKEKVADGEMFRVLYPNEADSEIHVPIQIRDVRQRVLWSNDFGYNASAPEGNTVAVSYRARSGLLLLRYVGYKFDSGNRLLWVQTRKNRSVVGEYNTFEADLLPALKRQKDFEEGYEYAFEATKLTKSGAEIECIALKNPGEPGSNPFAQDQPWYRVTAVMNAQRKMIPVKVVRSNGD